MILKLLIMFTLLGLASAETCSYTTSCSPSTWVNIRFPFRLKNHDVAEDFQSLRCGYPGFDLSCNHTISETIISFPLSGDFAVNSILYSAQKLIIGDPLNCLPKRFIEKNFSLIGTPFRTGTKTEFTSVTFLNCSSPLVTYKGQILGTVPCLGQGKYTVHALRTEFFESEPQDCEVLATVLAPVISLPKWWHSSRDSSSAIFFDSEVELQWDKPNCSCGYTCGFLHKTGLEIGCLNDERGGHGISDAGKTTLVALTMAIPIIIYICIKSRSKSHQLSNTEQPSIMTTSEPNQERQTHNNNNTTNGVAPSTSGLSKAVIETYPRSLVGESSKLLSSNYKVCPICLSEYGINDALRTLPDCFHYFHADCVDEWLKLNATCPMCRNSPLTTPSIAC